MRAELSIALKSGARLTVERKALDGGIEIAFILDGQSDCLLHWGLCDENCASWKLPPESIRPAGTKVFDDKAVQTPFEKSGGGGRVVLSLDKTSEVAAVSFVLFYPVENLWDNNNGRNYTVRMPGREFFPGMPWLSDLTDEIVRVETGRNSWTLMHRFNLCHDLADRMKDDVEGLALLYVWLRFSAIRQLDWQRNYNTKPRELSHSQDRLTLKLAEIYIGFREGRELVRLMTAALGRGGEGQRIRDEILNIMHRHNIKEVAGHFMEEWHQKLHNNTTPDDIVICEAYLAFLRSNGNRDAFYDTLRAGGVTKERLESFERPIVTPPDFIHWLKDGLIHDFEHFLGVLKSVHSGTDLNTAVHASRRLFDNGMNDLLTFILRHKEDAGMPVAELASKITFARRAVKGLLENEKDAAKVRDALFLDVAMEEFLRTVVERKIDSRSDRGLMIELIGIVLENVRFSHDSFELSACARHWERLRGLKRFDPDWALHAKAVLDRLSRELGTFSDGYHRLLQPKAETLGRAFRADSWAVTIFSEEIVRGRPAFVLSMLLHYLDPILRKEARLGDWQIINPGAAYGRVETVGGLREVQGMKFDIPTVLVAGRVMGDEEPPEGTTAVITPDMTDIVSHVAIRARNANILFATCYDNNILEKLRALKGRFVRLAVSAAGDVVFEESAEGARPAAPLIREGRGIARPKFTSYAVPWNEFREGVVGGKSNNLKELAGKLPDSIRLPASAAIPFGVFENVLSTGPNTAVKEKYDDLVSRVEDNRTETLAEIRKVLMGLELPEEFVEALSRAVNRAGLKWPDNPDRAWACIKQVWASKWNERAYLSRKARGIAHDDIFMAVLMQEVVEAEYSFVIHSVNPSSRNEEEIYAEVVLGLGETLVGNYPGRALSFTADKRTRETAVQAYPSKSVGLFGGGLIFRSDSNGEDLTDYAGAGLYDSVMLDPPQERRLDYSGERLVWDDGFRRIMLDSIAEAGVLIEKAFGSAQDIEGAFSEGKLYVVQSRPQL